MADWSGAEVEAALIDAVELWRRSPSTGFRPCSGSPFATDGPWAMLTRRARAGNEWDAWRAEIEEAAVAAARDKGSFASSELPVGGLSREEVGRRDRVSEWLALVPEADRGLVVAGVWWQGTTGRRIDWARMLRVTGQERGKDGLRMRYRRALDALAKAVSAAERKAA